MAFDINRFTRCKLVNQNDVDLIEKVSRQDYATLSQNKQYHSHEYVSQLRVAGVSSRGTVLHATGKCNDEYHKEHKQATTPFYNQFILGENIELYPTKSWYKYKNLGEKKNGKEILQMQ